MSSSDEKKRLIRAIVQYLQNDSTVDEESRELAAQVITKAYDIDVEDSSLKLPSNTNLQAVFNAGVEKLGIVFEQNIENDPKFKAFISQLEKMGYFKESATESRQQKMEKAKQKFIAKTAENPKVLAEKAKDEGNQLMKVKKYKEAIECYKKAVALDPSNPIYPSNMAAAYLNLGDTESGVKCCKKAIELDATFHKGYFRLGTIYDRSGRLEEALEQYELALQHSPGNKEYIEKINKLKQELGQQQAPTPQGNPFANMFGGGQGGMPDLSSLLGGGGGLPNIGAMLQDPNFMNMAMNLMQQPGVQQMMQGMMQSMGMNAANMGSGISEDNHRAAMNKILEDPEVQSNPRLKNIFEDARDNGPQTLLRYVSDPEVSQFMMRYASQHIDTDQLNNMFGGAPPQSGSGDDNNNMYS